MEEVFKKADIFEGIMWMEKLADDVLSTTTKTKQTNPKQMAKHLNKSELRKSESWPKNTPVKDKIHDKPFRQ